MASAKKGEIISSSESYQQRRSGMAKAAEMKAKMWHGNGVAA
jgi:hypothetical protein